MKSSSLVLAALLAAAAASVQAQSTAAAPSAGMWQLSVTQEGTPMGGGTRTGQACLAADALTAAPEQTLMEAARRQLNARQNAKCEFKDIRRDGSRSSWQAVCEGPMGKMLGTGAALLAEDAAELQQAFSVKASIGTLNIKQTVTAKRLGSC